MILFFCLRSAQYFILVKYKIQLIKTVNAHKYPETSLVEVEENVLKWGSEALDLIHNSVPDQMGGLAQATPPLLASQGVTHMLRTFCFRI